MFIVTAVHNFNKFLWVLVVALLCTNMAFAWGFWAHKKINHAAIFTLPKELQFFYARNSAYLTQHAVDPDKKRYVDSTEASKHYIDLENYPQELLPATKNLEEAQLKFGKEFINKNGSLPWQIALMYQKLVQAFKMKDSLAILKLSAHIGHYIADATVPLHTTTFYDGKNDQQRGIHALWERHIPEQFGQEFKSLNQHAFYIQNLHEFTWKIIYNSHKNVGEVLNKEGELSLIFKNRKYKKIPLDENSEIIYSKEFISAYHLAMNGMVSSRFNAAILDIGSIWYSAWVDAGKPNLNFGLKFTPNEEENIPEQGMIKGRHE